MAALVMLVCLKRDLGRTYKGQVHSIPTRWPSPVRDPPNLS